MVAHTNPMRQRLPLHMTQTHFEKLIADEKQALADLMFKIPLGDSHRLALTQGRNLGLDRALELYRQAAKIDLGEDGV